jgi:hypothetical protein
MYKLLYFCLLIIFSQEILYSDVFYVSTTGMRTSGTSTLDDWTNGNCYGNIIAAIQQMSGGDSVVVNDGTYSGVTNVIGRHNSVISEVKIPSGSSNNYSVVCARNAFQVTLDSDQSGDWNYHGRMIYIFSSDSFIVVDGFKGRNRDGGNNSFVTIQGNHIKIIRCLFRTEGAANNENTVLIINGDDASYILVEDCAMTGNYRYGFGVIGYANSPDTNRPNRVIFRRCIARGDYSDSSEPFAMFSVYGHNGDADLGPHDIMYQNCIAIDQNASVPDSDWKPYGPWYVFKGQTNITLEGCILLSNDQTGSTSGAWITEDYGDGGIDVNNSVFYGFTGIGISFGGSDNDIDRCTFGGSSTYGARVGRNLDNSSITNSLFLKSTTDNLSGSFNSADYNSFQSGTAFGNNQVTYNSDLLYLPRVEITSNRYGGGASGANVGAHITKKHGRDGALWGDTGWNMETSNDLWPWQYEDEIKNWFKEANDPPSSASPNNNDTRRGFCEEGQTLTKYIWEYLDNTIPDDIYNSPKPEPPQNTRIGK